MHKSAIQGAHVKLSWFDNYDYSMTKRLVENVKIVSKFSGIVLKDDILYDLRPSLGLYRVH